MLGDIAVRVVAFHSSNLKKMAPQDGVLLTTLQLRSMNFGDHSEIS